MPYTFASNQVISSMCLAYSIVLPVLELRNKILSWQMSELLMTLKSRLFPAIIKNGTKPKKKVWIENETKDFKLKIMDSKYSNKKTKHFKDL